MVLVGTSASFNLFRDSDGSFIQILYDILEAESFTERIRDVNVAFNSHVFLGANLLIACPSATVCYMEKILHQERMILTVQKDIIYLIQLFFSSKMVY